MAQTTTTTLATIIPTEMIVPEVIREARPFNVVAPLVINGTLPKGKGPVWSKPKLPTTSAASVAEAADITATARTTTEANVTVSEVGLSTEVTLLAEETAAIPPAVLDWAGNQGRAIAQKITGDLCALFAGLNASSAIGTSGTNLTVANFLEAMYTLDAANAPGRKVCVLHPRQVSDLFAAVIAAGGAVYHNLAELIREGRLPSGTPDAGFVGDLFGVPIYSTTEVDTANSAADYAGAMFVKEAMAFVQLRPITVEYDSDKSARSTEIIVHTAYGVGEVVELYGVPLVTDA